ncbi:MAG TPA: metallopeptidase family protein [Desulfotomaculum sp.]|nr:metallopeptidase family protein [Desulfotomaculum sp.]
MSRPSFEEFSRLAEDLVDEIPPRLCRELNGGFVVSPEEKRDGEFYILGEYIEDEGFGRLITLYYGSFATLLGEEELNVWQEELRETIRHELRHHLEALAGVDDLAREELQALAALLDHPRHHGDPFTKK